MTHESCCSLLKCNASECQAEGLRGHSVAGMGGMLKLVAKKEAGTKLDATFSEFPGPATNHWGKKLKKEGYPSQIDLVVGSSAQLSFCCAIGPPNFQEAPQIILG